MTRLKESDIHLIICQMRSYDRELMNKTGHTLAEIAIHAVRGKNEDVPIVSTPRSIAVIPFTCGQGVIPGFSETVAGILCFLGMNAFVTSSSDAEGFAEALERKTEIIFMADDNRFIAVSMKTNRFSDNSEATGKGYTAALDYLSGGLIDHNVLLLGAGPVGRAAAFSAIDRGGKIHVYDRNSRASEKLALEVLAKFGREIHLEKDLDTALHNHRFILDCCPEAEFIKRHHLYADSFIAAPGVPLGIHSEALEVIGPRLIHDPLQLGVATMLYELLEEI